MFKKRRGINIPYNDQGLVHFICVNHERLPEKVVGMIVDICVDITKEHSKALFRVMTDDTKSIRNLALEHHISETQLYHYRKIFYERAVKELIPYVEFE